MLIRKRHFPAAAILLFLAGVQAQHSVTLSSRRLCFVTGSTVKIQCTFKKPYNSIVKQTEWYRVFGQEPRVLNWDPQYSGRVSVKIQRSDCELTVSDVSVNDSGVYNFRFKTLSSNWISAPSGVHLTVTDLKVTVSDQYSYSKTLSCTTTCALSNNPTYIWYRNGHRVTNPYGKDLYRYGRKDAGSYSCAVEGYEERRSPAVCVFNEDCWSVTYSTQTICSLIGSSVDIQSYYTYPNNHNVRKSLWFIKQQIDGKAVDVRDDDEYKGRVQYTQSSQNNCSLKISNLKETDAQTYRFRFYTDHEKYTGQPGVSLSVTDLEVKVYEWSRWSITLSCITTCALSNNLIYIWYRNGQPVTYEYRKDLSRLSSTDAGSYSCTVRGYEERRSPAVCVFNEDCWSVTYSTQTICSLIGSSVDIQSYYTYPKNHNVRKSLWFIKQQIDGEAVDLRDDEEYKSRVQYTQNSQNNCNLRISNLKETDAQTYRFRFYTDHEKYTGQSGVSLSVTDLEVRVSELSRRIKLSCITTCALSNNLIYIWYRNGQPVTYEYRKDLYRDSSTDAGSYSCAVEGHEERRSPAVCVFDKTKCLSVTYSTLNTCALIGSSVDVHSYYTFPNYRRVNKVTWFIKKQVYGDPVDLRDDEEYKSRVQYIQNSQNNCSLRITNLRETDAQTYRFRFYPDEGGYTGEPGVSVSVTGLKILVSDWNKRLSCSTTCTLSDKPTYIWYKNGQRVTERYGDEHYQFDTSEEAGSYSCSIRGHEELQTPAVYPPKNTTAVLLSGEALEGGSVTLSCSSDANPPVQTYSWFKAEDPHILLTKDQIYTISNLNSQHSGLYYCTVHNLLGHHDSTPVHLDVFYPPKNTKVLPIGDTVEGESAILSCSTDANPPVQTFSWFKIEDSHILLTPDQNYTISNLTSQHSGLYYCTAHNLLGHHDSTPVHLDVLYAPRNTSVTVIPSDDPFTLLCWSDSNPTSSYTWYWRTRRGVIPTGNGTNFTLSPGSSEGFYFCTAENRVGSSNSSEWAQTPDHTAKYAATGFMLAAPLVVVLVVVFVRRRGSAVNNRIAEGGMRTSSIHSVPNPCPHNEFQNDSTPVYGNVSAVTADDVQYCTVHFRHSHPQDPPLYSTVDLPKDHDEKEEVEYTAVSLNTPRSVQEDEIYSNMTSTQ